MSENQNMKYSTLQVLKIAEGVAILKDIFNMVQSGKPVESFLSDFEGVKAVADKADEVQKNLAAINQTHDEVEIKISALADDMKLVDALKERKLELDDRETEIKTGEIALKKARDKLVNDQYILKKAQEQLEADQKVVSDGLRTNEDLKLSLQNEIENTNREKDKILKMLKTN